MQVLSPGPSPACYEGDTRLANQIYDSTYDEQTGRYLSSYAGRVEVCYNGEYRPICEIGWDQLDAEVACRSVGYGPPYYCEFILGCRMVHSRFQRQDLYTSNRCRSTIWFSVWGGQCDCVSARLGM